MAAIAQFGPKFQEDDPAFIVQDLGAMSPKLANYVLNDVNGTGAKFAAGGYFTGWNNEVIGFIPEYTFGTNTNRTFLDILKTLPGNSPATNANGVIAWANITYIPNAVQGFKGTLTAAIRASIGAIGNTIPVIVAANAPTAINGDDLAAGDWTFGRVNH